MVLPAHVIDAVTGGDISAVAAWLDEGGDVNDVKPDVIAILPSETLLMLIPQSREVTSRHVEMARMLLRRGADVNYVPEENRDGFSALHLCVDFQAYSQPHEEDSFMGLLQLYIDAGGDVNLKDADGRTSLGIALTTRSGLEDKWHDEMRRRRTLATVTILLRNGASLDAVDGELSAEEILRRMEFDPPIDPLYRDEYFIACKALVADMRAAGGKWKQYVLHMPKALLRLRSLIARGRARTVKRLRARTPREIELLLAPAFPNELCWRVLEYWNPRYEARRTPSPRPV